MEPLYSASMTADELASLASYSIRAVRDLDSGMIDGLKLAVYRDSTRKFEFADSGPTGSGLKNLNFSPAILVGLRPGSGPFGHAHS